MGPWPYPSSKGEKDKYLVVLRPDSVLACNCLGWKILKKDKQRACGHVLDVIQKMGFDTATKDEFVYVKGYGNPEAIWTPKTLADPNEATQYGYVNPMLASPMPEGRSFKDYRAEDWLMELKYNGQRCVMSVQDHVVRCWSRPDEGLVGLSRAPLRHAEAHVAQLPDVTLDCEEWVPGKQHQAVRDAAWAGKQVYAAFDMMKFEGKSIRHLPVVERRSLLKWMLNGLASPYLLFSEELALTQKTLDDIKASGGEGAMLKRRGSPYQDGARSLDWIKAKFLDHSLWQIIAWKKGKNGPHSVMVIRDKNGVESACKTRGMKWLKEFAAHHDKYLWSWIVLQHHGLTPEGKPVNPVFDHPVKET